MHGWRCCLRDCHPNDIIFRFANNLLQTELCPIFFHSNRSIEKSRCHPLLSGRSVANRTMLKNLLLRTQAFEIEMSVLMVVHE